MGVCQRIEIEGKQGGLMFYLEDTYMVVIKESKTSVNFVFTRVSG